MELLDIGIHSLTDFESDKRIPPDRVVKRMVEVYHSKTLGLVHLRNKYDIAMQCIPESFIAEMEAKEIAEERKRLYQLWVEKDGNDLIESMAQKSEPKREEKKEVEVVGNVIYCDFGKAV